MFGKNYGTIKNVNLINANVSGKDSVGGIAGYNSSTVKNSFSATKISGTWNVGAVVGFNVFSKYSGNEYASNVGDSTGAIK